MSETRFMRYNYKVLGIAGGDSKIKIDSAIVANQKTLRGFLEGETVLAPGSYSAAQLLAIIKKEFPSYVPPARYTITATVDPAGAGNVSGTGTFDEGATCTLSASPVGKYVFKYWDGDPTKTTNPLVITVTGNEQHIAKFEETVEPTYTVTVTNDGNGTASAAPTSGVAGTQITLVPVPNTGYHFSKFESDDVTVVNNKFNLPAKNVTVKAIFEQDEKVTLTLNVSPVGAGDVSGAGEYDKGTSVNIAANASTGYQFKQWSDGNTNISRSVVVNSDMTLTAEFEPVAEKKMYTNAYVQRSRNAEVLVPNPDILVLGEATQLTDSEIADMKANGYPLKVGDGTRKYYEMCFLYPKSMGQLSSIKQAGIELISIYTTIPYSVDGQDYYLTYKNDGLITAASIYDFDCKW